MPSDVAALAAFQAGAEGIKATAEARAPGIERVSREVGRIVADGLGYLIGDPLAEKRARKQERLKRESMEILEGRGMTEPRPISAALAFELLAAASDGRDDPSSMWARLLANAQDPSKVDRLRPEFIDTMKRLHPQDALILIRFGEVQAAGLPARGYFEKKLKIIRSAVQLSLETLVKLGQSPQALPFDYALAPIRH